MTKIDELMARADDFRRATNGRGSAHEALRAALEAAPVQGEHVATVGVKMTGGNAGIATIIKPIKDENGHPLELPAGTKLYTAPAAQTAIKLEDADQYDQQAMELCENCGWKAVMPGEPCLLCSKPDPVQAQTPPPLLTDALIDEIFSRAVDDYEAGRIEYEARGFARAIEAAVRKQFGVGDD